MKFIDFKWFFIAVFNRAQPGTRRIYLQFMDIEAKTCPL